MPLILYDLAGAEDERRFSPYCWRIKLALAHKGLEYSTVPWRFTEKDRIVRSGGGTVPVLVDGDTWISDSWAIAGYLEQTYPDRPSLFGNEIGRSQALFIKYWAEQTVHPALLGLIVLDVYRHLHPKDKDYFRQSREQRFGMTLEQRAADPDRQLAAFRTALGPLRTTVTDQPFISGEQPGFADYIAFGPFQWARCVSPLKLLEPDDPVGDWRRRMLDLYDGLAGQAPGYPV